jgi:uncharacterized phage protein (TIGR02218 family)
MKTALPGVSGMQPGEMCEFYKIVTRAGQTLCFSTFDVDLDWDGHTFVSAFPIEREDISTGRGLEVNDTQVAFYLAGYESGGIPLQEFALNGGFKYAQIIIYRAKSSRVVHLFEGRIASPQANREKLTLKCKPTIFLLNIDMPRNKFQSGCLNTLFDPACGLDRSAWAVSGTAQSGSTAAQIVTGLSQPDNYFALGKVVFTTGENAGISRFVYGHASGIIYFSEPLPHTPAVGDSFTAYPGCNRTKDACQNKFFNLARMRAFPYIPLATSSL